MPFSLRRAMPLTAADTPFALPCRHYADADAVFCYGFRLIDAIFRHLRHAADFNITLFRRLSLF